MLVKHLVIIGNDFYVYEMSSINQEVQRFLRKLNQILAVRISQKKFTNNDCNSASTEYLTIQQYYNKLKERNVSNMKKLIEIKSTINENVILPYSY